MTAYPQNLHKETKKLARPDIDLHYQIWNGTSGQPPLVFIHGWAGSVADWEPLEPYLDSFQGLAYDAAGFGLSQFNSPAKAKQADYSIARYVEDLRALLEAENLPPVRLVGHSWGGVIAMAFAASYPERVLNLVAIGSAYFDPKNPLHLALKWVSYLIVWLLVLGKKWLRRSARLRRLAVRRYFYRQPAPPIAEKLMNEVLASDNQALFQTLLAGYEVLFKVICPKIKCPTLYLGCQKDVVAPPAYVKAFVPLTPDANYFLMNGCGHFPMLEQPAELGRILKNFWETHPSNSVS
jgi:pimeloyl-ACP methyl ester carboxylesterase